MLALSLGGLVFLLAAAVALAVTGDLTQPAGTDGCISEDGAGPCADGHALEIVTGVAVSPDGKSVYATNAGSIGSSDSSAVVRFDRDTTTGAITEPAGTAGCVSETGAGGCADGHGLLYASALAVSPDGKSVYVTSYSGNGAVARLNRNTTTGAITQPAGTAGCVSETGTGGTCADGHGLKGAFGVAVSPDGKSVYVASGGSQAVARFNRGTTSGGIAQPAGTAGCISETGAGPCADGHGLNPGPTAVAVSPDGKNIYATTSPGTNTGGLARLQRNTTTGAITQFAGTAGCVSETGTGGTCADGRALKGAQGVAVSPDGKSVYVASGGSKAVARLNRGTIAGAISQPAGTAGCVSETGVGPCADGHGLDYPVGVAVSPDGTSVYVAAGVNVEGNVSTVARFIRAP